VLLGALEDVLAASERALLGPRGAWEHLQLLRSTSEDVWSVCGVCM